MAVGDLTGLTRELEAVFERHFGLRLFRETAARMADEIRGDGSWPLH
jgi:hypothetical protein